jgi:hypothetical protein
MVSCRLACFACLIALVAGVGLGAVAQRIYSQRHRAVVHTPTEELRKPVASLPTALPEKKAEPPKAPADEWLEAPDKCYVEQDLAITVGPVRIGSVKTKPSFNSDDSIYTVIPIVITNRSTNRKVDYCTWPRGAAATCELKDDKGNQYAIFHGDIDAIEGQNGSAAIYPGKTHADILLFERPVDAAQILFLQLSADVIGGKGCGRFKLALPKER